MARAFLPLVVLAALCPVQHPIEAAPPPPIPPARIGAQAAPTVEGRPLLEHVAGLQPTTIFHVNANAANADDNNPGTAQAPWRTIRKAVRTLGPGQAAHVHTGTYREDELRTANAGDKDRPIWLMEAPGEEAVILGDPARSASFLVVERDWWVVDGFEIDADGQRGQAIRFENSRYTVARNLDVHQGRANAAVVFWGAWDAVLLASRVHEYTRTDTAGRLQDSHGVLIIPTTQRASERVLVQSIDSWGHSGDSVQCAGGSDAGGADLPLPRDITVVGSRFGNTHPDPARTPRPRDRENAVDIKSCQAVSILRNKMFGYRPAESAPGGAAVVVHYNADNIRIQGNRFWDSGLAASVGSASNCCVGSIAFHRNLVFDLAVEGGGRGGAFRAGPTDAAKGAEVWVTSNTFFNVPAYGVRLGDDGPIQRAVILNNILTQVGGLALDVRQLPPPGGANVESDRNLFFQARLPQGWLHDRGSIVGQDPLFVDDPRANDFYTKPCSPARDAAVPTGEPFQGGGLDIGFLENPDQGCAG